MADDENKDSKIRQRIDQQVPPVSTHHYFHGPEQPKDESGSPDFRFSDQVTYTEADLKRRQELLELELREEKADTQRRMAWTAMVSMSVFTVALFLPIFTDSRINALADILGLFYIAQAGIVGAFMGVVAWMSRK